ncbi:group I truncated hemoglobin [Paenibacillus mucilaginosus]|uniref:Group 1 truncated hemoglobin n=3 Tax=Paenibacillus mucilaginosus TaxID=61624 RepID=H6NE77_9BACL|nr:group 1 truncated hemoglobin [Paenibacillus mucilaginosus]AEI46241.1 hypothetical protein KNP414_07755 [Paenibacillus mucilaginosus KNP414]AFC33853.1 hypothetical protein PM3016_7277 [Paenibacillus mucilaginosus 3016]AFH66179.1 globin [Paenibacillus mucilaginosus K02]MCG7213635.1 group 1 truncated hemoglobin [Paenibacillus mucilaginosus]WDM27557.1 group 1 truncated hemoglobin [Paenibacillus mucilaginosus]
MSQSESIYEKLGGEAAIGAVVDIFYKKVLADDTVNGFFKDTDMEKQRRHQTKFLSFALGGPAQYTGASMAKAHEGMNLQPIHWNAIVNHLTASLREAGVGEGDIDTIVSHVATLKDDILNK